MIPSEISGLQYENTKSITSPLTKTIVERRNLTNEDMNTIKEEEKK